jgi:trigger factor
MTDTHAHDHGPGHDHEHGHDHSHHPHGPERKFTVSVATPSQTRRVLSIRVPAEEVEGARAAVLAELKRELRVPGFRKGKVPVGFIEKNYADVIQSDAVRNLLPDVYEQALEREHLHPLGEPVFENVKLEEGGVRFDVRIEVRPDVVLKGYDRISVDAAKRAIADGDVDDALSALRERLAAFDTVQRPAQASDHLVIDYVPLLPDGQPEEKSRVKGYPVALSGGGLLPEFQEALVGTSAGEEKEIRVKYPADFGDERVAGTERSFHVRVNEVKEKLLPEVDDSFAKRVDASIATVLELKLRIRARLEAEEESRHRREVDEKIVDAIITANPFEVPEVMVENYLASLVEEDRRQRGTVADEAAREREIREMFREAAVRTIRKYFVLDAVRRQERISVSNDEVEARIQALAQGLGKPAGEVRALVAHPERRRGFESDLVDEKTMSFLRERSAVRSG